MALLALCSQVLAEAPVGIEWGAPFDLPPAADGSRAIGVGAPYYGEHNGVALLAGGSNFPDTPLLESGAKRYYDTIWALEQGSTNWFVAGRLSRPAAEGVSATTPRGVVCVGGTVEGQPAACAFLLTGVDTPGQMAENLRLAALGPLPAEVLERVAACVPDLPESLVRPALWCNGAG